MKNLYLMRHGETLFNERRRIQGWCDSPLTPLGIRQAQGARKALENIVFDHYYCSTAERCSDTLELITSEPYVRLKGLKERYFGTFEGESEDLNPPFEYYDTLFPLFGGETGEEVARRMVKTLTEIMEKKDHETVLAVSHAGASLAFLGTVGNPQKLLNGEKFTNCSILHFIYEGGVFQFAEVLQPR